MPRILQKKLSELFGLILRKGYVEDPQILVGAYGDTHCDTVPLQISQFESDNRVDDALDNLFLEGAGGGNAGETPTVAWYFLATHTQTDAWDKREKKGYAFTIGDEIALNVTKAQISKFTGDNVQGDITPAEAVRMISEKWELFHLVINNSSANLQHSVKFYTELLGDHCIVLQDEATAAEVIAGVIGMYEGTVDLDTLGSDLTDVGSTATAEVKKALAVVGASRAAVAVSDGPSIESTDGATRL